jgi:hypothetical protein
VLHLTADILDLPLKPLSQGLPIVKVISLLPVLGAVVPANRDRLDRRAAKMGVTPEGAAGRTNQQRNLIA